MKKTIFVLFVLLAALFFYHQYEYAGPYDAILRHSPTDEKTILENLKRWRYHTDVWFEIVPDALTTIFKRLGIGGWSETDHRVCAEGCPYWTEDWTDGFYSIDLELNQLTFDQNDSISFEEPRYLDIEIWGKIHAALRKKNQVPTLGQKVKICGPLRIDRPYYVYTIQPDQADEIQVTGTCEALPKENKDVVKTVTQSSCDNIGSFDVFKQIALLDSLADQDKSPALTTALEKMVQCVSPQVLDGLATNPEVQEKIVSLAPSVLPQMKTPIQRPTEREDHPVRNTISDLIRYWTNKKI